MELASALVHAWELQYGGFEESYAMIGRMRASHPARRSVKRSPVAYPWSLQFVSSPVLPQGGKVECGGRMGRSP